MIQLKTNKQWYKYNDLGHAYRLFNSVFLFAPLLLDGNIERQSIGEVDLPFCDTETLNNGENLGNRLRTIKEELINKV